MHREVRASQQEKGSSPRVKASALQTRIIIASDCVVCPAADAGERGIFLLANTSPAILAAASSCIVGTACE
jgi:hypothetical protein